MKSQCKSEEKITRQFNSSLPNCKKCKNRWILLEEFQEVESNYSGRLSYVSSQLAMIPSSRSKLSRDKRLPIDTWNTSGLHENVLGNQFSTFDSPRDHPQRIHSWAPQRERGSAPQATGKGTLLARDDKQSRDTSPMPTFARVSSTMSCMIPVDLPRTSMVGQQR